MWKESGEQSHISKLLKRADILFDSMDDKTNQFIDEDLHLGGELKNIKAKKRTNFSDFYSNFVNQSHKQPKKEQHSLKNQISVDHIDNPIMYEAANLLHGEETAENLLMSKKEHYLNTDYAKKHKIFNNYEELTSDLKSYFKKKITEQIGADKLESTKGIFFNAGDTSSKKMAKVLANNSEFVQKVTENQKSLKMGNFINTSIQFTDNNFKYAVGKADIRDLYLTKQGTLDLLVTDVYDFNDNKDASDLIKVGRDRQEKGEIIPYFYIYHVIIPKNIKLKGKIK